jgi:acyl-CoA thioester hydrolase
MFHTYTHQVVHSDTDGFGHMNNNSINEYFERARVNFVQQVGLGYDVMNSAGFRFVVSELNTKYHSEIFSSETFDIWTRLEQTRPIAVNIKQVMTADGRVIAKQDAHHAFKRVEEQGKEGRIARIPLEVLARLSQEPETICKLI